MKITEKTLQEYIKLIESRNQFFKGKLVSLNPATVVLEGTNVIQQAEIIVPVTILKVGDQVGVFKELNTNKYYVLGKDATSNKILNKKQLVYNRRKSQKFNKINIFYFLLDVSNSIEMEAIYKVKDILEGNIETPLKIERNDLISISSFSDNIYEYSEHINKLNKKTEAIEILNNIINGYNTLEDKYDRYDSNSFDYADFNISLDDPLKDEKLQAYSTFWVDEGTDLPENGVDAIYTALSGMEGVYKNSEKTFYLITDNSNYSQNVNNENDVYDFLLSQSKTKLYFDIVAPVDESAQLSTPLIFGSDVYIRVYLDRSGSMETDIPAIQEGTAELGNFLITVLYGTEENKNIYFNGGINWGDERWLSLLNYSSFADKVVVIAFINESSTIYHRNPRTISTEPTSAFTSDLNTFISDFNNKIFAAQKVYSVDNGLSSIDAFNAHLIDAIEGNSPYSTNLRQYNVSYEVNINTGASSDYYFEDILSLLQELSFRNVVALENISAGSFVYAYTQGGRNYVKLASSIDGIYSNGFVLSSINEGESGEFYSIGVNTVLTGLITDQEYYLSLNGGIVDTAPTEGIVQKIGKAKDTNSLYFYLNSFLETEEETNRLYTSIFPPTENKIIYI